MDPSRAAATPADAGPRPVPGERFGVVVIGRNEGERLRVCLASALRQAAAVVYVDSGSVDGSVELARSLGVEVVMLDLSLPFTAARARNAGWRALRLTPGIELVQFVDGDCELQPTWCAEAVGFLDAHPALAAVCGRRRERFPERSVYNRLCDLEWDTPVGPAQACGGDAMMRMAALLQVEGFCDGLIAGEEPELCVRLRARGWQVWRLDAEMTLHDAAMARFGQWWKRSMRAGYAFAEGAFLHGAPPERHWVRESRSAWLWGLGLPVMLLLAGSAWPPALWGFMAYPLQVLRIFIRGSGTPSSSAARAFFIVLGKFAEAAGQVKFVLARHRGLRQALIEYK